MYYIAYCLKGFLIILMAFFQDIMIQIIIVHTLRLCGNFSMRGRLFFQSVKFGYGFLNLCLGTGKGAIKSKSQRFAHVTQNMKEISSRNGAPIAISTW